MPSDYSRIVLAGLDQMHVEGAGTRSQSVSISDHGKFYRGRCTDGGTVYATEYPEDDNLASRVTVDATDRAVDFAREFATGRDGKKDKKDKKSSWLRFDAGLGLEWNKYRFTGSEVLWDATAAPNAFALGADLNCTSRLKTRYVTIPLSLSLGDRDGWHIELTALPGLGWTGKNTGLRRQYGNTNKEKDYSVNRSLAPYKLDLRAAMMYNGFGIYFQVATLSTLRDGCQELFPVKFGIIL